MAAYRVALRRRRPRGFIITFDENFCVPSVAFAGSGDSHQLVHQLGMPNDGLQGDAASQGIAENVGIRDLEVIALRCAVVRHDSLAAVVVRPSDPAGGQTNLLPEKQVQLCGMFLDVAHVVQKQLRVADLTP